MATSAGDREPAPGHYRRSLAAFKPPLA